MSDPSSHVPLESISLIGFDVRRAPSATRDVLLGPERREECLLVPDCDPALSADRSIWPSIFYLKSRYDQALIKFPDDVLLAGSAEDRYFDAFDLWDNIYAMRDAYAPTQTGDCGVAFGLVDPNYYGEGFQSDSWFDAIYDNRGVIPPRPGTDWPFLGFDVVNSGFMSGLSGFGPLANIAELRQRWAAKMNPFCLFSDRGLSMEFAKDANQRLVADGPFFAVGIFLLWDTSGEIRNKTSTLAAP